MSPRDTSPADAGWPWPLWIAHRGAGKLAPENTLAAMRLGAQHGYRAFECDVKLAKDGVPFLLHDSTLERTSSGHGVAAHLDWRELSQLDAGSWHSRAYAGEAMPTFDALATWCLRNGHALDIEIKPSPGAEAETGRVVATRAAARWQASATKPLLTSFKPDALAAARDAVPSLPRGLLLDTLRDGWLEEAQALGCAAVVTNHALMDATSYRRIVDAGMRAVVYTVNDPAEAHRLIALGIHGIVTDAVDRFSPGTAGVLD